MPSDCRSPATSATGALTVAPARGMRGGSEGREQQIGLAMAGEAGEADDLALARDQLPAVRLSLGAHAHHDRRLAARCARGRGLGRVGRRARRRPSRQPASPRSKLPRDGRSATTLPSRMTTMRSQVASTSPRIWEIRTQLTPASTERRTCARSCPAVCASSEEVGSSRMTRRAGASETVKARAISTICLRPMDRS